MTSSVRVGVDIRPFRAWVLAPERLRGLADRHATPWDRVDVGNSVRLLGEWKRLAVLARDERPAMYVYEQSGPLGVQRGVISAVHLDSRLLPHEDVTPAHTDGMVELMRAGEMSMPPILLGYSGTDRIAEQLDAATRRRPLTELRTPDGQEHRVWRLAEREICGQIIDALHQRAALIADGHHRHVAARRFRRDVHAAGHGRGPWDYLPALLVDTKRSPLRLRPVHRVLPHADPWKVLAAAQQWFQITALSGPLEEWLDVLRARAYHGPAFIVATPDRAFLLDRPDAHFLSGPCGRFPESLRSMHISVLQAFLDTVRDSPAMAVHYEPSAPRALHVVREVGGIAAITFPPSKLDLSAAAATGVRLPPKATAFGPNPHPGLVLRTLPSPRLP
ncbi:DUF1015 family protein [Saccharopolyspora gloriosae]|uniref:Uncharacterized protein (DUF1015 family) n=1 Tax=Saccharopolyspora gloriosae TaxID=455344 RepID=A0A840NER9_9PSEU|nr:uncharacterized protein (DUF1015 family) [Saccharopolyspora gloriosae]